MNSLLLLLSKSEMSLYFCLPELNILLIFLRCKKKDCTQIYPWIHQYTNNVSADDMTSSVKFPDINPEDLPEDAQLSMIAGDFLEVSRNNE